MRYYVFESGSKGNCTLIASNNHYLIIDDGISPRKLNNYLADVNVDLKDIKAVLLTHSHADHISGIKAFSTQIIYASKSTVDLYSEENELIPYHEYYINGFKITVIPTSHDARGSIGFIIEDNEEKLVYITDTGYIYERVLNYIKGADYYIFEANHNVRMQLQTGRPQYLIDRIMGDHGHLSNEDSALYLSEVINKNTKEVILAHLSEEANTPELAIDAFYKIMNKRGIDASNINIRCASQHQMVSGGNLLKEFENGKY